MSKDYVFLVKICSKESYAKSVLDGKLFMNTIDYYRNYEESDDFNIADTHEGLSAWIQPEKITIKLGFGENEFTLSPEDLVGPIIIKEDYYKTVNIFCLTALHSNGVLGRKFSKDDFEGVKNNYFIAEDSSKLGEHCIFIYNFDEFIRRVDLAISKLSNDVEGHAYGAVNYFDEKLDFYRKDIISGAFAKRPTYKHQKEFRVAIQRKLALNEPMVLDIGSIRDIAIMLPTSEFNKRIKLSINEK